MTRRRKGRPFWAIVHKVRNCLYFVRVLVCMVEDLLPWGDNFHSLFVHQYCTLFSTYLHCTENSKRIFPEMKLHGFILRFCIHVSVSDLCISTIGPPILLYCVCGPTVAIYKLLTDIRGASKIKVKNVNKKRTVTVRRLIIF